MASTICINYLRQIDDSTQTWAIERHKDTNAIPTWDDIPPYMKVGLSAQAEEDTHLDLRVASAVAQFRPIRFLKESGGEKV